MKEGIWRGLWVSVLLYCVFAAVYLYVAFPKPPKPKLLRTWAAPHTLVSDSVLYGFVRELLSQSSSDYNAVGDTSTVNFYVSRVLFENDLMDDPEEIRLLPHTTDVSGAMLQQLCTKDHLLTSVDTSFMRQQAKYSTGFALNQKFLPGYSVITAKAVKKLEKGLGHHWYSWRGLRALQKRYSADCFSWLSMPLFSHDRQTVIIGLNYKCLEENGHIWVLQRRQGKWRKVKLLSSWES